MRVADKGKQIFGDAFKPPLGGLTPPSVESTGHAFKVTHQQVE